MGVPPPPPPFPPEEQRDSSKRGGGEGIDRRSHPSLPPSLGCAVRPSVGGRVALAGKESPSLAFSSGGERTISPLAPRERAKTLLLLLLTGIHFPLQRERESERSGISLQRRLTTVQCTVVLLLKEEGWRPYLLYRAKRREERRRASSSLLASFFLAPNATPSESVSLGSLVCSGFGSRKCIFA